MGVLEDGFAEVGRSLDIGLANAQESHESLAVQVEQTRSLADACRSDVSKLHSWVDQLNTMLNGVNQNLVAVDKQLEADQELLVSLAERVTALEGGVPIPPVPEPEPPAPDPAPEPEPEPDPGPTPVPEPEPPVGSLIGRYQTLSGQTVFETGDHFYVAVDGSDANSGTASHSPFATLKKALHEASQSQSASKVIVLLSDLVHDGSTVTVTGASREAPLLIRSQAGMRFKLYKVRFSNQPYTSRGNIAFLDLDLRDMELRGPGGSNFLFERCLFRTPAECQGIGGAYDNVQYRFCRFLDIWNGQKVQGLYCYETTNLLVEYCIFDGNGWDTTMGRNDPGNASFGYQLRNHNMYITRECGPSVVRFNIVSQAASHGSQQRGGGVCQGNLYLNNPIGAQLGYAYDGYDNWDPVFANCRDNVFIGGDDIGASPRGQAVWVHHTQSGSFYKNRFCSIKHNPQWNKCCFWLEDAVGDIGALVLEKNDYYGYRTFRYVNGPGEFDLFESDNGRLGEVSDRELIDEAEDNIAIQRIRQNETLWTSKQSVLAEIDRYRKAILDA